MLFTWIKRRRRRRLLAAPFPEPWLEVLQRNVHHYAHLPHVQQAKLRDLVKVFVAEKFWEGYGGLKITDEVRVTVAAQACLLALGTEPNYYFDGVKSILVYPDVYAHPPGWNNDHVVVVDEEEPIEGEAWRRGPVVLSWAQVLQGGRNPHEGRNLVLHEFAHQLDGLDGETDGEPPLRSPQQRRTWYRVTEQEYRRLLRQSRQGRPTLLDPYGAASKAEFFAVSTECFFEQPAEMQRRHPELYDVLRDFYRQDPAQWPGGQAVG